MLEEVPKNFEAWKEGVPKAIRQEPLWDFQVYPKALFLYELAWLDCERLIRDPRGKAVAEQLIRSVGSICANIEEGYGRGFGKDYARFLGFSLGSARESKGWYFRARFLLPEEVIKHRLSLLNEIIALLIANIQYQRKQ